VAAVLPWGVRETIVLRLPAAASTRCGPDLKGGTWDLVITTETAGVDLAVAAFGTITVAAAVVAVVAALALVVARGTVDRREVIDRGENLAEAETTSLVAEGRGGKAAAAAARNCANCRRKKRRPDRSSNFYRDPRRKTSNPKIPALVPFSELENRATKKITKSEERESGKSASPLNCRICEPKD